MASSANRKSGSANLQVATHLLDCIPVPPASQQSFPPSRHAVMVLPGAYTSHQLQQMTALELNQLNGGH